MILFLESPLELCFCHFQHKNSFTCIRAVWRTLTQVCEYLWTGLWGNGAEVWRGTEVGCGGLSETKTWDDRKLKRQNQLCIEFKCSPWLLQENLNNYNNGPCLLNIWLVFCALSHSFLLTTQGGGGEYSHLQMSKLRQREVAHPRTR